MSVQNHLVVNRYADANDAPIFREPEYKSCSIRECNVVKNGTVKGQATVDVVVTTADGQNHVVMLTGALVRSIVSAINAAEGR